jgi:hypothetical protein
MGGAYIPPKPRRCPSCQRKLGAREQLVHGLICQPCTKTKSFAALVDQYNARQTKRRKAADVGVA